jgi:hypothetical protein
VRAPRLPDHRPQADLPVLPQALHGLVARAATGEGRMNTIAGVGADAPMEVKPNGAKQSSTPYRLDLIDARAWLRLGAILAEGAEKYGVDNWRGLSAADHANHLLIHIEAYLAGDRSDDHLGHALARSMMLYAVAVDTGYEVPS